MNNALLIVACLRHHPQLIGWYQAQYLIACYAVVLQMHAQQPTAFGDSEAAEYTLNSIEILLEQMKVQTVGNKWTVDMLKNVRMNLQASGAMVSIKQTPVSALNILTPNTLGGI